MPGAKPRMACYWEGNSLQEHTLAVVRDDPPSGALVANAEGRGVPAVHRNIEILIGRLITDEEFRRAFRHDPRSTLANAAAWGLELTSSEANALLDTDPHLWDRVASEVDARLQKASLRVMPGLEEA